MGVTGLILAGGSSSRFGSDKAQARYGGRTFITLAYDRLKEVCADVVISGWDHHIDIEGILCIPDISPGGGPMSGIATAVRQLQAPWLLIIPCDMPLLTTGILQSTIKAGESGESGESGEGGKTVVWQWEDGHIQPFPMLLNRQEASKAIDLLGQDGGMSVKAMLRHIPYTTLAIPRELNQSFSNINTQSEFENLKL